MEMQSKTRVELRLKVKVLFKMSNWEKDSGWSRKKNRLITLGHLPRKHPVKNVFNSSESYFIPKQASLFELRNLTIAALASHGFWVDLIVGEMIRIF